MIVLKSLKNTNNSASTKMKAIRHPQLKSPAFVCGAPGSKVREYFAIKLYFDAMDAGIEPIIAKELVKQYLEA